jgi:8-oxo-dGTP diphosphatase
LPKVILTNMVMIEDRKNNKVLVQDRIKSYKGYSFPGGHVKGDESFYDSAVREVKEETGLDVSNLSFCGIIHWLNKTNEDRYIVFLYKTHEFKGTLLEKSEEGRNIWISLDELVNSPFTNNLVDYLPMFLDKGYGEAFAPYTIEDEIENVFFK